MTVAECYDKVKAELTGFGKNAVADVGKIMTLVQASDLPEKDVMLITQHIYITHFQKVNAADANQARQSWVTASGNNFESFIRIFINQNLNAEGILAVKGDRLRNNPKAADIVVLTKEKTTGAVKAFALLNCKTSDHSRNDAVLFWALALRDTGIKYCLVTQDLDKRFDKGDNDNRISALRRKAEAFLDRVYSTSPSTTECSQVKKLVFNTPHGADSLLIDLRRWRQDVVPDYSSAVLREESLSP
jgi:hypothetical protein